MRHVINKLRAMAHEIEKAVIYDETYLDDDDSWLVDSDSRLELTNNIKTRMKKNLHRIETIREAIDILEKKQLQPMIVKETA